MLFMLFCSVLCLYVTMFFTSELQSKTISRQCRCIMCIFWALTQKADDTSQKETSQESETMPLYTFRKRDTNLDFLWQCQAAVGEKRKKERESHC